MMGGIQVYQAQHPTVELTLAALQAGELRNLTPDAACGQHGQGHGGHHHGPSF
jgi:hypothetical protein